jgi:hypothetical protein
MTTAQALCSSTIRDEFPAGLAEVLKARGSVVRCPAATGLTASDAKMVIVETAKNKLFIGTLHRSSAQGKPLIDKIARKVIRICRHPWARE